MIAKLRVLSGALVHASGGDTFWPVQFGFLAKLPAFFGCIIALSALPGDVSRKAAGGTAGSCVVAQAASRQNESEAQVFFMTRDPFRGFRRIGTQAGSPVRNLQRERSCQPPRRSS